MAELWTSPMPIGIYAYLKTPDCRVGRGEGTFLGARGLRPGFVFRGCFKMGD